MFFRLHIPEFYHVSYHKQTFFAYFVLVILNNFIVLRV